MFSIVDTSGDRRVSLEEFDAAVPQLIKWGAHDLAGADSSAAFSSMAGEGDHVLFDVFADWALRRRLDLEDDDDADDPSATEALLRKAPNLADRNEAVGRVPSARGMPGGERPPRGRAAPHPGPGRSSAQAARRPSSGRATQAAQRRPSSGRAAPRPSSGRSSGQPAAPQRPGSARQAAPQRRPSIERRPQAEAASCKPALPSAATRAGRGEPRAGPARAPAPAPARRPVQERSAPASAPRRPLQERSAPASAPRRPLQERSAPQSVVPAPSKLLDPTFVPGTLVKPMSTRYG